MFVRVCACLRVCVRACVRGSPCLAIVFRNMSNIIMTGCFNRRNKIRLLTQFYINADVDITLNNETRLNETLFY